jgi:hypothetical protein
MLLLDRPAQKPSCSPAHIPGWCCYLLLACQWQCGAGGTLRLNHTTLEAQERRLYLTCLPAAANASKAAAAASTQMFPHTHARAARQYTFDKALWWGLTHLSSFCSKSSFWLILRQLRLYQLREAGYASADKHRLLPHTCSSNTHAHRQTDRHTQWHLHTDSHASTAHWMSYPTNAEYIQAQTHPISPERSGATRWCAPQCSAVSWNCCFVCLASTRKPGSPPASPLSTHPDQFEVRCTAYHGHAQVAPAGTLPTKIASHPSSKAR